MQTQVQPRADPAVKVEQEKMHVLIIDDNKFERYAMQFKCNKWLNEEETKLSMAPDEATAWSIILVEHIDLILVDVHMPDFDVVQFASKVSAEYCDIAIVTVSADESPQSIAQCLSKGAIIDYIVKPMEEKEIKSLHRYIQLHKHRLGGARARAQEAHRQTHAHRASTKRKVAGEDKHGHILVFDDSEFDLQTMQLQCQQWLKDFEVLTAADEDTAWKILTQQPVDLILVDLHQPDFDVVQFASRVSAEYCDIAIVTVSADESAQSIATCLQNGAIIGK